MNNENNNQKFNPKINTARIDLNGDHDQSVFPARSIYNKTADNMALGEDLSKDSPTQEQNKDDSSKNI